MKHIKVLLLTAAILLCTFAANAHDFEVDGIYYNITSSTSLTVEVTYRSDAPNSYYFGEYDGAVIIPATVTYEDNTYSVTGIGNAAFRDCNSLTSITIPEVMKSIGNMAFSFCI